MPCLPLHRHSGRRRGFSLVEIMFAIVILGIGFIMVAAIFPVAIQQTQETKDDTIAAQVATAAVEGLRSIATDDVMPVTLVGGSLFSNAFGASAQLVAFSDSARHNNRHYAWHAVRTRMIHTADPRYAWSAVYARETSSAGLRLPYATVFVFVVKSTNTPTFTDQDISGPLANLQPREVFVAVREGTVNNVPGPDIIQFVPTSSEDWLGIPTVEAVAEGTFVLIAEDNQDVQVVGGTGNARNVANGRVYRVGRQRPDLGQHHWELQPGWDMPSGVGSMGFDQQSPPQFNTPGARQNLPIISGPRPQYARAYIMGRSFADPANPSAGFSGPSMDVGFYMVFVPILR